MLSLVEKIVFLAAVAVAVALALREFWKKFKLDRRQAGKWRALTTPGSV